MSEDYPPYNYFICPECDKEKEMSRPEFAKHLKTIHQLEEPIKGVRNMMMHINKKPRHAGSFEWTINDMTFYEYYG